MQAKGTVVNKITTLFSSALTGTDVSDAIVIPDHIDYIVISSQRHKTFWICDESGNKQIHVTSSHDNDKHYYYECKLAGCTIKLQGTHSDVEPVYVVGFHGV